MKNILNGIKSFLITLKAGSAYRRATRLRKKGSLDEAYKIACGGLALLHKKFVDRNFGPESTEIVFSTMLVEQLAQELGKPGADESDIRDTFRFLNDVSESKNSSVQKLRKDWLPYFENRIKSLNASQNTTD